MKTNCKILKTKFETHIRQSSFTSTYEFTGWLVGGAGATCLLAASTLLRSLVLQVTEKNIENGYIDYIHAWGMRMTHIPWHRKIYGEP